MHTHTHTIYSDLIDSVRSLINACNQCTSMSFFYSASSFRHFLGAFLETTRVSPGTDQAAWLAKMSLINHTRATPSMAVVHSVIHWLRSYQPDVILSFPSGYQPDMGYGVGELLVIRTSVNFPMVISCWVDSNFDSNVIPLVAVVVNHFQIHSKV